MRVSGAGSRSRKRRGILGGSAVVAILVGALVSASAGSSAPTATCLPAPKTVKIGTFPYGITLAIELAEGAGRLKALEETFCTEISIQSFATASLMVNGLSSDQLQYAYYSLPNNLLAAQQGLSPRPVMIASATQGGSVMFVAKTENRAQFGRGLPAIKKFYDTATVLAQTSTAGAGAMVFNGVVDAAGGDFTKLKTIGLGSPGVPPAVLSGRSLLGQTGINSASLIVTGQLYNVLYGSGKTAYKVFGAFPQVGLNVMPAFARQYPQLTQAIVNENLWGLRYIRAHWKNPGPVYNLLKSEYRSLSPYSLWPATWRYNAGTAYPATGIVRNADVLNVGRLMKKYGVLPADFTLPSSNLANPVFAINAYKALKLPVPKKAVYEDLIAKVPD